MIILFSLGHNPSAYGEGSSDQLIQDLERKQYLILHNMVHEPLTKFRDEEKVNCDSVNLNEALSNAAQIQMYLANNDDADIKNLRQSAKLFLDIGDIAFEKQCFDFAEKIYKHVIETYVGLAYIAYRELAIIGLTNVRDARHK